MSRLLWKEYRQNRAILVTMLTLLMAPYLFMLCLLAFYTVSTQKGPEPWEWKKILFDATFAGPWLVQVGLGLIGGNAIAGERADRSAEFQGALPIRRRRILAAKILLTLLVIAVIWLPNMSMTWAAGGIRNAAWKGDYDYSVLIANIAITGLVFFCAAWLASSLIVNPAIAACAGLATPPLVLGGSYIVMSVRSYLATGIFCVGSDSPITDWYQLICLAICPVCFAVGVWLYLRRVEP